MSRVDPVDDRDRTANDRREQERNQRPPRAPRQSSPGPNPSKSEGDERTVDEALNNED